MMNRTELKQLALALEVLVEYDRYGVPRRANGESLGAKPWISLQELVMRVKSALDARVVAEVREGCPATPAPQTPSTLHHVTPETPVQVQDTTWDELTQVKVPEPQAERVTTRHPLRGYRLSTKEKVLDALYRLKRVKLGAVVKVQLLAQLLAKHFGADVRIRVIQGVTHLLVHRGSDRVAFAA